ncbi:uncharacterized protein LOC143586048 [Bidens hawaiensis]|uniref:uncharacterized protein LOC143586048 n=1 Tax=Bidens hawaiensis TaxID=980011 RepID=UPI00404B3434
MDWFSWLSKSHIQPPFIHEYALVLSHKQLEEDDIPYFNHKFLQSMGISIAKHRLEILKLARKSSGSHPIAKLVMNKLGPATLLITNGYQPVVGSGGAKVKSFSGSLVYDLRQGESMEDGGEYTENLFSDGDDDGDGGSCGGGGGGGYWSGTSVEEIKWDAMFQDLKPT